MNRLLRRAPTILQPEYEFKRHDESSERFWLGSILKAEGGVDFTQGASVRAMELLFWAAAMELYLDNRKELDDTSFDDVLADVEAKGSPIARRLYRSMKRYFDGETSAAGRILKSRSIPFDEDKSKSEAVGRARWLWKAMSKKSAR
jgi:hypothetical protein